MIEGFQASSDETMGNGKWGMVSKVLGPIDLHYHFRTKPLLKFFASKDRGTGIKILEYGCGAGANLFELKSRLPAMTGVGIDIDRASIDSANRIAVAKGYGGLTFVCADTANAADVEGESFDYVLLIDVLEHLNDPRALLDHVEKLLKPDGRILISVPTHRYPRVFGLEFHHAVGHVREGFSLAELDELLGQNERTQSSYNTGLLASAACACFYRVIPKVRFRKLAIVGTIGLHLSRLADVFNGASTSCSLWAVYRRRD